MPKGKGGIKILYEDNHVIGLVKPARWLSQGDDTEDESVLDWAKAYIKQKYDKPGNVFLGCVHRLDKPSSGVMVYAKTSKALKRLNRAFSERQVVKKYLAIVEGSTPKMEEKLVHYLKKNHAKNKVKAYAEKRADAKKGILQYRLIGEINRSYLLDISLETGRPHQIRVQLAQKGFPIVGDVKYGAASQLKHAEIALHCLELQFTHPTLEKTISLREYPPNIEPWRKFKDLIKG